MSTDCTKTDTNNLLLNENLLNRLSRELKSQSHNNAYTGGYGTVPQSLK